ncbi:lipoprotein insertase outer membrane protein LolB [Sulfuriflexus mobilis]|uniref:lipoprotein insertase outer membrane protein LolB n=1 Tax=Sulfuriflexus mobilis TaxID=1811807 RepID=UPI000F83D232|nr:lipoprotein insertase outer membrane protein LolB [Sulfuriflexus mobilis]
MMRRWLYLCGVLLSGCEMLPVSEAPIGVGGDPRAAWAQHQLQLNSLEAWTLDGRISLRHEDEAWHASLRWQQIDSAYHINLFGPFGQGAVQLDGSPQGVTLQHNGETVQSNDAEQLLRQHLGLQVPVNGLRYWAVGLAAPDSGYQQELDPAGRLAVLHQNGWRVRYRGYVSVQGFSLPGKVFLDHDGLDVRLVVDQWQAVGTPVAGMGG